MTPDVAIVGGGLSGGALALRLAGQGRRVVLAEREPGPYDKVCGEFLSAEAVQHLHALGLDPAGLGGVPIGRVRLSRGRLTATADLPFQAIGLSRRVLDQALLDRAQAAGASVLRGANVRGLEPGRLRLDGGHVIEAADVVLATGKHELRGHARPPGRQNDLVGFKQHLRLAPMQRRALDGQSELTLFPGGYAGLQMVSPDIATLCLLVRRSNLLQAGGTWPALLRAILATSPQLARRLSESRPVQERPLSIARIPYGLVSTIQDEIWRLGDQAVVIPSFTGDGMSIALHSAALCARLICDGARPSSLQTALVRDLSRQVGLATWLSRAAVQAPVQHAAVLAARLLPPLSRAIAAATRISEPALAAGLAEKANGAALGTRQRPGLWKPII